MLYKVAPKGFMLSVNMISVIKLGHEEQQQPQRQHPQEIMLD